MRLERTTTSVWLSLIAEFLERFGWLADSFVLDFYVDDHWAKLPRCWREYLDQLDPASLSRLVDLDRLHWPLATTGVPPLGLLAFKQSVRVLSLPRKPTTTTSSLFDSPPPPQNVELRNLFTRHVKLKKRHEVQKLAELIWYLSSMTGATHVYDVGSGLGHLSRYLTYVLGLQLTCVDNQQVLSNGASKFDRELESFLAKKNVPVPPPPQHVSIHLELNHHHHYFQSREHPYGLVGLHSCGNLSPLVLHNYAFSPGRFVASLGCCYMKMDGSGFPLSDGGKRLNLSYEALEVACHALEQYCHRCPESLGKLKTHSYRAALETILVKEHGLKRAGLRSVPHSHLLTFQEYALAATKSLDLSKPLDPSSVTSARISAYLAKWFRVVLFYSLRLMVGGVVESAVLLDRAQFLLRDPTTSTVLIIPLFDPELSPRNLALVSWRKNN